MAYKVDDDKVSIHAPYIGSDDRLRSAVSLTEVSIHAPYIGSDEGYHRVNLCDQGFNPRSLHRERRTDGTQVSTDGAFQSTLPT